MKSRITIEVDFDNGNPYIKVAEDSFSDDVRDKLVTHFRQKLGHTSSWCKIDFRPYNDNSQLNRWVIQPISPSELEEQSKIMAEQARLNTTVTVTQSVSH